MIRRHGLLLIALGSLPGCAGTVPSKIFHPGPAWMQQKEAEKYDPYPLPDVGPDMAARPLAFIRPASETERAQDATTFEERYGQPPPPGIYRPPRSSSGPQIQYVPVMPLQNAPAFVPPATLPPPSGP
jgi:hypothetical protein